MGSQESDKTEQLSMRVHVHTHTHTHTHIHTHTFYIKNISQVIHSLVNVYGVSS